MWFEKLVQLAKYDIVFSYLPYKELTLVTLNLREEILGDLVLGKGYCFQYCSTYISNILTFWMMLILQATLITILIAAQLRVLKN